MFSCLIFTLLLVIASSLLSLASGAPVLSLATTSHGADSLFSSAHRGSKDLMDATELPSSDDEDEEPIFMMGASDLERLPAYLRTALMMYYYTRVPQSDALQASTRNRSRLNSALDSVYNGAGYSNDADENSQSELDLANILRSGGNSGDAAAMSMAKRFRGKRFRGKRFRGKRFRG